MCAARPSSPASCCRRQASRDLPARRAHPGRAASLGQGLSRGRHVQVGLELAALYEGAGIKPDRTVVTYCRIGERSSHSWYVLRYLLGYPDVRNYDGSWTEWGNLVSAPIEKP